MKPKFPLLLVPALVVVAFTGASSAAPVIKAANATNLDQGASWVGGVAPTATDTAVWNNTVTAANTTTLGTSLSWDGLQIVNPTGAVTINGTAVQTLTLGAGGIDLSTSTVNLTLGAGVTLGAAQSWNVNASRGLNHTGILAGADLLTKAGGGALTFTGANTFTGKFASTGGGRLGFSGDAALGAVPGSPVADAITLDNGILTNLTGATSGTGFANGWDITLGANRGITLGAGGGTIQLGYTKSMTVNGVITGPGTFAKTDNGTLTLAGANTYLGATAVSAGRLNLTGTLTSDIAVAATATLTGSGSTTGSITFAANSTLLTGSTVLTGNGVTATASPVTVAIKGASTTPGTKLVDVIRYGSGALTGLANFSTAGFRNAVFSDDTVNKKLTLQYDAAAMTWDTANATWSTGGAFAVGPLNFQTGDAVTFDAADTVGITGTVAPSATLVNLATGTLTFNSTGNIGGTGTLTKEGAGTLVLSTPNTYTGQTFVNAGLVQSGNATAFGVGGGGAETFVASGATIDLNGISMNAATNPEAFSIAGSGVGGIGAFVNNGVAQNNGINNLTLTANASIGGINRFDIRTAANTPGSRLDLAGFTLTKTGVNNIMVVNATGGITPGNIVINQGMFGLEGTTIATGSGTITINPGATLGLYGKTNANDVTRAVVSNGGTISNQGSDASIASPISLSAGTITTYTGTNTTILAGVISGGGGVEKTGTGTFYPSAVNTYTGKTTITAGTIGIGSDERCIGATPGAFVADSVTINGGTLSNVFSNGNAGSFTISANRGITIGPAGGTISAGFTTSTVTINSPISGTGNLTKGSGATLVLTAAGTLTGTTSVPAGTLRLNNSLALQNSTFASGLATAGALVFNSNLTAATLGGLSGARNLALQNNAGTPAALALSVGTNNQSTAYSGVFSGAGSLIKIGTGTLTVSGANTYTGATTITGGTLALDYSTQDNSKLSDTDTLNLNGGTLSLSGGAHVEIVSATNVGGVSSITQSSPGSTVYLGPITRNPGGLLDVASAGIAFTASPNDFSGILPGVTFAGAGPAMNDGGGVIVPFTGFVDVNRLGGSVVSGGNQNIRIIEAGVSGNITLSGGTTDISTLLQAGTAGPSIVDVGVGNTLRLGPAGLILSGTGASELQLTNGTLTAGGLPDTAGEVQIVNNSVNPITIGSVIADNGLGIVSVTKSGAGSATFTGANTYTGATNVAAGTLNLQTPAGLGTNAAGTTVQSGATLELQGGINIGTEALSLSGAGLAGNGALRNLLGDNTAGGAVTLATSSTVQSDSGTLLLSGAISGANRTLTKTGAGTLRFTATTAGSLPTNLVVANGTASFGGASFSTDKMSGAGTLTVNPGATALITAAHALGGDNANMTESVFINGGTLTLDREQYFRNLTLAGAMVGGTSEMRACTASNFVVNGSVPSAITAGVNLFNAGNFNVADVTGTPDTDLGISGVIAGGGALNKSGAGTMVLTATNTYTGDTNVTAGTLSLGTPSLADTSTVRLSTGAVLNLSHGSTDTILQLVINGVSQASGTWGAIGSGAQHETALITGTGILATSTNYQIWAFNKGLTGANNAPEQDPDNDGRNNLSEFAFDGNPLSGMADGKNGSRVATVGSQQVLTLTLPFRTTTVFNPTVSEQLSNPVDGMIYHIQGSDDLVTWNLEITEVTGPDATAIQSQLPILVDPAWTYRTFRTPGTIADGDPRDFIRARVETTP